MDTKKLAKNIQDEFNDQQVRELKAMEVIAKDILWYLKRINNDTGHIEIRQVISKAETISRMGASIQIKEFAKRIPLNAFERFHRTDNKT